MIFNQLKQKYFTYGYSTFLIPKYNLLQLSQNNPFSDVGLSRLDTKIYIYQVAKIDEFSGNNVWKFSQQWTYLDEKIDCKHIRLARTFPIGWKFLIDNFFVIIIPINAPKHTTVSIFVTNKM